MPMGLKSRTVEKNSKLKMIEETTTIYEHKCTPKCFRPMRRPKPPNLRRVSLGYIYMSSDGRFYHPWGKGDWLSVEGVDFCYRLDGALVKFFRPTVQLHIHSPGGRTTSKQTTHKEIRPGAGYYAQEAAKQIRHGGANLQATQRFLAREAAKVVPHAPKNRKPLKGTGRGAPGQPRSLFSKQVVDLRNKGVNEAQVVESMLKWLREQGERVTPLNRSGVRKRVHRWFSRSKKNSARN
jgi:hypothetical protein